MPNDPNDDIQIKPIAAAATGGTSPAGAQSDTNPAAPQPAGGQVSVPAGQSVATGGQSSAAVPVPAAPAAPTAPAEPTNKRAFNLEADVETSAMGQAKPEKFAIPKIVKEKYPDLIDLIKNTESMDDQERQYWFQILPVMTTEQVEKFKNILITEKQQLSELDKEYEDELNKLNEKHLLEWKEFESKEKSRAIQEAEAKSDEQEKAEEEALLAKLSDV